MEIIGSAPPSTITIKIDFIKPFAAQNTVEFTLHALIQTLIATKDGSEWRLAAFQNTRLMPMGRSAGATFMLLLSDWLCKLFASKK